LDGKNRGGGFTSTVEEAATVKLTKPATVGRRQAEKTGSVKTPLIRLKRIYNF
jgi:hypothetical protein